ncbi:MAG: ISAzo13 family transposase [Anaerolineae bacterium]
MAPVVAEKFGKLRSMMNEKLKRRWAGCEAMALGRGGISLVSRATGMSRATIRKGLREVEEDYPDLADQITGQRIRRPGGGRRRLAEHDPGLESDLRKLVEPATRGEPTSPLLWTSKSTRKLAKELQELGHEISYRTVARMLRELGFSLQANRKTREGKQHPDRDAQFQYIAKKVRSFQRRGEPVVSVDAKKRELVGDFKNGGREWRPKGQPENVRTHDFRDKELGVAIPYGVYDQTQNNGWVSVGIDRNTAEFATESIRRWWRRMGSRTYPQATELLITADAGGSNGARCRLWKVGLQELADELGIRITVCHFPPGTSKWNKIEHRMFCHITENWRGQPLISQAVIVNLIGNTTTKAGLTIKAQLDTNSYETGVKVSDQTMARLNITKHKFHGDWNYTIAPSL